MTTEGSCQASSQVVGTVELIHSAGFVHGGSLRILVWKKLGLTTHFRPYTSSNVSPITSTPWSDSDVYLNFGRPKTDAVSTRDGSLLGPAEVAEPTDYVPATVPHFQSPEARFEERIFAPSDWPAQSLNSVRDFPFSNLFLGGGDEVNCGNTRKAFRAMVGRVRESSPVILII